MNEATLILSIVQTVVTALALGGLFLQLRHSRQALEKSSETIQQSKTALEQTNETIRQTNKIIGISSESLELSRMALGQTNTIIELSSRALQDNVDFKSLEYYVKLNDIMLNNKKVKEALFSGYEQNELHLFLGLAMSFFEDLFLRKLDKKIWEPWAKWMDDEFLRNDAFQVFWNTNKNYRYYTKEFRKEIDGRLTKL